MSTHALILDTNDRFQAFKAACNATPCDFEKCSSLLRKIKPLFAQFPTFSVDGNSASPTRSKEVVLARETLEYAVLLSSKMQNMEEFEHNISHLNGLYEDYPDIMPSERRWLICGLNLLRLLAQNRTLEFHVQLELIPLDQHENMYLRDVIQLERFLMEGSYRKLLQARTKVPSNDYVIFLNMMVDTVRTEIADCSRRAYEQLSIADASKLLMFENNEQTSEWAKDNPEWVLSEGRFVFERPGEAEARALPFQEISDTMLGFAHEAERII